MRISQIKTERGKEKQYPILFSQELITYNGINNFILNHGFLI